MGQVRELNFDQNGVRKKNSPKEHLFDTTMQLETSKPVWKREDCDFGRLWNGKLS